MRDTMARWIVDEIVPVEGYSQAYLKWRPPVRDAMMFVVARLSPARLAPKLLEQLELPLDTSAEVRLLRLIAKVPGLQAGAVIARNQHLRPALRNALERLEKGSAMSGRRMWSRSFTESWDRESKNTRCRLRRRSSRRPVSARWCAFTWEFQAGRHPPGMASRKRDDHLRQSPQCRRHRHQQSIRLVRIATDYNIAPAGNSGIMFHVGNTCPAVWFTGPEFQLEDNQLAEDPVRCGWLYALYYSPID